MRQLGSRRLLGGGTELALGLTALIAVAGLAAHAFAASELDDVKVFKLHKVSTFERSNRGSFLRGQMVLCRDESFAEVKAYPRFESRAPIYGLVQFGMRADDTNSGAAFYFALDESRGTGKGYDRLYFDLNRDLDLRDDPAVARLQNPPESAKQGLRMSGTKETVVFDFLKLNLAPDSGGGVPVEIMPRLTLAGDSKSTYKWMCFVRTRIREGEITVGGERFHVTLGNDYVISGSLDSPGTALILAPSGGTGSGAFDWWDGDRLMAMHRIRGVYYSFSTTPTGDELRVRPYRGDLGTFEIGAGNRTIKDLSVTGSLQARDRAVPVGGEVENGRPKTAPRCQLPTGDYLPTFLTVQFGRLRVELSQNYHSDGKPRDRAGRPPVYGIAIRKERPFVLDFSNPPDVMFASPARDQRLKPGDELEVKAVLVDPKLDMMIRGLDDTSRKTNKAADGSALGYERYVSLDPKVIITRANGDKVAEGVMPFG